MKLFNKNVYKNTEVTLSNLVTIEGYAAGQGRCPFVSQVKNLEIAHMGVNATKLKKAKTLAVNALICTASIPESAAVLKETLAAKSDGNSKIPTTFIIVVSDKFMKLSKKQQLVLLELESSKLSSLENSVLQFNEGVAKTTLDKIVNADVTAIQKYGRRNYSRATKKAVKVIKSGEFAIGKVLYKDSIKMAKAAKKVAKSDAKIMKQGVVQPNVFTAVQETVQNIIHPDAVVVEPITEA